MCEGLERQRGTEIDKLSMREREEEKWRKEQRGMRRERRERKRERSNEM
jgi:hypothetical protein